MRATKMSYHHYYNAMIVIIIIVNKLYVTVYTQLDDLTCLQDQNVPEIYYILTKQNESTKVQNPRRMYGLYHDKLQMMNVQLCIVLPFDT